MLRKHIVGFGALLVAIGALAVLAAASVAPAKTQRPAATTIRIWVDANRLDGVTKVAKAWGAKQGVQVQIVQKGTGNIRSDVSTVKPADAPDVIVAAMDWTGELSANGSVVPLYPKKSAIKNIPKYALQAFSYGPQNKLYGMPTTVENIALFVNTKLGKVPHTFAQLEKYALAFKKKGGGRVALDVQQGARDAYHMYPLFSGLCGYIFGHTKTGALNPKDLGIANKKFIKNASLIDKWNKEGFVNAKIDANTATSLFTSGKAAYWITGPWNLTNIRNAGISFKIIQVPKVKCGSVPFLGVNGFMVTKYAAGHHVAAAAKDFVSSYMAQPAPQITLNTLTADKRAPANTVAAKKITDPALKQIGLASKGGVPMPNIPQMNSVWTDLGDAWVKSTKGEGATPAKAAFQTAASNIKKLIAGG